MQQHKTGLLFAFANNIIYAFVPVFGHYFVRTIDPLLFGALITLVGAFPFMVRFSFSGTLGQMFDPALTRKYLMIGFYAAVATALFYVGTKYTSGLNTTLLINTEPVYALFLGAMVLKELVIPEQIVATALMMLGAVIIIWNGPTSFNFGDILVLISPLFFQLGHLISKKMLKTIPQVSLVPATRLLYGGIMLLIIAIIYNPSSLHDLASWHNIVAICLYGFIFRTLDLELWYQALKRMPLGRLTAMIPMTVGISFLGAVLVLHEMPLLRHYIGLLCIACGLLVISYLELRKEQYVE